MTLLFQRGTEAEQTAMAHVQKPSVHSCIYSLPFKDSHGESHMDQRPELCSLGGSSKEWDDWVIIRTNVCFFCIECLKRLKKNVSLTRLSHTNLAYGDIFTIYQTTIMLSIS